jgi:hypothetical protein
MADVTDALCGADISHSCHTGPPPKGWPAGSLTHTAPLPRPHGYG